MSEHEAPRRRARRSLWQTARSTRARAALSLGMVVGLGATGTLAYWTDEATIATGSFTAGTLDLTAGPTTGAEHLVGTGPNTWALDALTLTGMIPGDSVSKTVVLRNSGDAPFRLNGTVTSTTNDLTTTAPAGQGIQVVIVDGATATDPTHAATSGVRTGGCTAGTSVYAQYVSTTSTSPSIYATAPTLTPGQTRTVCVRAILSPDAPNVLQAKSTAIKLALTATQVAP